MRNSDEDRAREIRRFVLRLGKIRFGPPKGDEETSLRAVTDLQVLERMLERLFHVLSWRELLDTP